MQQEREAQSKEQQVDPWTVHAAEGEATINYDKLIGIIHAPVRKCVPKVNIFIYRTDQFGSKRIDQALVARIEAVTKNSAHHLLRRGVFFSHR